MTPDERQLTGTYLAAKEAGFVRMESLRSTSTAKLDDHAAVEMFARITGDTIPATSHRSMTGLITQQAWFRRLHERPDRP